MDEAAAPNCSTSQSSFTAEDTESLHRALLEVAAFGTLVETVSGRYSRKYVVDGAVRTPDGRSVRLRTVWIVLSHDDVPRFVTAYSAPEPEE